MRLLPASLSLLLYCLTCGRAYPQGIPRLESAAEGLDGKPQDICGPSDATQTPADKRVWMAQGRRSATIKIDGRERVFSEELTFNSKLIAVELDFDNRLLFTLTEKDEKSDSLASLKTVYDPVLMVSVFTGSGKPIQLDEVGFQGLDARDIRVNTASHTVLVVFTDMLQVFSYDQTTGILSDISQGGIPLQPAIGSFMGFCNPSVTPKMTSAVIDVVPSGTGDRTLAFITAVIPHPSVPDHVQPTGIIVCDITQPINPANQLFLTGIGQSYDPLSAAQDCNNQTGAKASSWRCNDVEIVHDGASHLLYVAGGDKIGLISLDVTNVLTSGFGAPSLILSTQTGFYSVASDKDVDPSGPDYLYTTGKDGALAIDRTSNPVQYALTVTDTGNDPPPRDVLLTLEEAGALRKLWATFPGQVDYKWKIADVTQAPTGPPTAPTSIEQRYASGGADGAVAVLAWDSIYEVNWGGVVRWDLDGAEATQDYDSYQPAFDSSGKSLVTEELTVYDFGAEGNPDRYLLCPTARGDFVRWHLSATAPHNPEPAEYFAPAVGYWPYSWYGQGGVYGNDIGVGVDPLTGHHIILIDYGWKGAPSGYANLAVGRFDWEAQAWLDPPIVATTSTGVGAFAFDLAVSDRWVFLGAEKGFLVGDFVTGTLQDWRVTYDGSGISICGKDMTNVEGIARYGDRVFVSLTDTTRGTNQNPFGMAAVEFAGDPVSGVATFGADIDCVFDDEGASDPYPDLTLTGGGHVQLLPLPSGDVRVYSTTKNGVLVELEYQPAADTLTPLAYWSNDHYFFETVDCPAYIVHDAIPGAGLGPSLSDSYPEIVVGKAEESWALVKGTPIPVQ